MINDTQNPYYFSVDTLKYHVFQTKKQQLLILLLI